MTAQTPMPIKPPIVYYISSHGYGHAARQQAVINELARMGCAVYVRASAPPQFFRAATDLHHRRYDVGMVQADALSYDIPQTFRQLAAFADEQGAIITEEVAFVQQIGAGLIVSDMPPLAMEIAERAGLPCIAITHFTWDWVYEHYLHDYPQYTHLVDSIRESYDKTTLALQLQMPLPHAFDMFPTVEPLPGLFNPTTKTRAEVQAEFDLPPDARVGLVSMGGHQWGELDLRALKNKREWVFFVDEIAWELVADAPERFRRVPNGYRGYYNLIAHGDVLVGKVGGSTIAEVVGHGTPMIYTTNPGWRETVLLQETVERYAVSCQYIERTAFRRGEWIDALDAIYEQPRRPAYDEPNGAPIAAAKLAQWL